MNTINIYRLYDPLDIQLLQLDIEQAAVDTGDFMPGYAKLQIFDNGFWTLTNELPPLNSTAPEAGGIEEAKTAAELWMKNFDTLLAGGDKERSPSAEEAYQTMLATTHPRYHPTTAPKTKKTQTKPKFFEHVRYIGGRSVTIEIDGGKQLYYRLVYGVEVKPSKDEEAVLVEDVEVVVEIWADAVINNVRYYSRPISKAESDRVIKMQTDSMDMPLSICYLYNDEFSVISPFYTTI